MTGAHDLKQRVAQLERDNELLGKVCAGLLNTLGKLLDDSNADAARGRLAATRDDFLKLAGAVQGGAATEARR